MLRRRRDFLKFLAFVAFVAAIIYFLNTPIAKNFNLFRDVNPSNPSNPSNPNFVCPKSSTNNAYCCCRKNIAGTDPNVDIFQYGDAIKTCCENSSNEDDRLNCEFNLYRDQENLCN